MAWAKIHDGFDDDADIDTMSTDAIALFVCALTWSSRSLTDGFIPEGRVRKLPGGHPETVEQLCAGEKPWWVRVEGGYQIRSFHKYNPSAEEVREKRERISEARAEAGRKGAEARWSSKDDSKGAGKADSKTSDLPSAKGSKAKAPNPGTRDPISKSRKPKEKLVTGKPSSLSAWLEFVETYPKRNGALGRAEAERKFAKLFDGPEASAILEGVRRYRAWADASGVTGGVYVAQMTTWLRERRWLEAYEIPAKPQVKAPGRPSGPREPVEGEDYVHRCSDGDNVARMFEPGTDELFNAAVWFESRNLVPTRAWERIVSAHRDLFRGAA